jgi:hypothetical protein
MTIKTRDYLSYWLPETAEGERAQGGHLLHCASSQFGRLRRGDTVWIVTVRPGGRLRLLGCVPVARVVSQAQAARILKCAPEELWDAKYHVIADPKRAQPLADVPLGRIAGDLRFMRAGNGDRLNPTQGRVKAEPLKKMRQLTTESAAALRRVWEARYQVPKSRKKLPATLEDAVQFVIKALSLEEREFLRKCRERDLAMHHHGLGMWIRNNLGLWGQNPALMKALADGEEAFYIDADWASGIVIAAVWKELRRKQAKPARKHDSSGV